MTIWKYPLEIVDRQLVAMPIEATILSVDNQHGTVCLWAMVDPTTSLPQLPLPLTNRVIEIFGTGHPMPEGQREFIGTVIMGALVWHVFEGKG